MRRLRSGARALDFPSDTVIALSFCTNPHLVVNESTDHVPIDA